MAILAIDTSTSWMCVALQLEDKIVEVKQLNHNDHSSKLMPAIEALMNEHQVDVNALEKIIVGNGPGSYTGTRIGVTVAKTMAWGLKIPIIPVSTLKLFAYSQIEHRGLICTLQDAKRQHVFASAYRSDGKKLTDTVAAAYMHIDECLAQVTPEDQPIFVGLGLASYQNEILNKFPKATIITDPDQFLSAKYLVSLAQDEHEQDAHDVTPNYLRVTQAEANLKSQVKG